MCFLMSREYIFVFFWFGGKNERTTSNTIAILHCVPQIDIGAPTHIVVNIVMLWKSINDLSIEKFGKIVQSRSCGNEIVSEASESCSSCMFVCTYFLVLFLQQLSVLIFMLFMDLHPSFQLPVIFSTDSHEFSSLISERLTETSEMIISCFRKGKRNQQPRPSFSSRLQSRFPLMMITH